MNGTPAGWALVGDKLEPIRTPNGLLARGGQLIGRCRTRECTRTVRVDLLRLRADRRGDEDLDALKRSYRCSCRELCGLAFDIHYPEGVPLQCYAGTDTRILIKCGLCDYARTMEVLQLIAHLERAGTGDGNTSILKVHRAIRGPCPKCRRVAWKAEKLDPPRRPSPVGGNPLGAFKRDQAFTTSPPPD